MRCRRQTGSRTQVLRTSVAGVMLAAAVAAALAVRAQAVEKYTARLEWVPIAGADRVSGKGAAVATLSGRALAINGTFDGLGGPATVLRVHLGIAKGARGKAITDIQVPKTVSGAFAATVTLTDEQVAALRQGRLYLQLHGDKGLAPDGANLWGWFLR